MDQRDSEFQQRIFAGSAGPHDPALYWRIFDPENVPGEDGSEAAIEWATDPDDIMEIMDQWAADEALAGLEQSRTHLPEDLFDGNLPNNPPGVEWHQQQEGQHGQGSAFEEHMG